MLFVNQRWRQAAKCDDVWSGFSKRARPRYFENRKLIICTLIQNNVSQAVFFGRESATGGACPGILVHCVFSMLSALTEDLKLPHDRVGWQYSSQVITCLSSRPLKNEAEWADQLFKPLPLLICSLAISVYSSLLEQKYNQTRWIYSRA